MKYLSFIIVPQQQLNRFGYHDLIYMDITTMLILLPWGFSSNSFYNQAVEGHIPILVRTMGSSSDLLEIISGPPVGSESLLMQVSVIS